jgi:hypothetical protein
MQLCIAIRYDVFRDIQIAKLNNVKSPTTETALEGDELQFTIPICGLEAED